MQSHTPDTASDIRAVTLMQQWQAYIDNVMQSKQRYLNLVTNQFMHKLALTDNWSITAPIDLDQGPIHNINAHNTNNTDNTGNTTNITDIPHYIVSRKTPLNATSAVNLKWRGARLDDTDTTMSLTTLHTLLPAYRTWAFRLNAENFGFVIIDIEENATPEEIDLWLSMPYLYAEHSMSGKGIHLVVDAAILKDNPSWMDFTALPKIQSHNRHVEILMRNHWVTFTGNTLPTPTNPNGNISVLTTLFNRLVDEHGKQISARNSELDNVDIGTIAYNTVSSTQIPYEDIIIPQTIMSLQNTIDMQTRLNAVSHDMSRYEYGILCTIKRELIRVLHSSNAATKARYDDETMARLIWRTLCWRTMEHADPDTGEVTPAQSNLPGIDHVIDYRDKWTLRRPQGTYITMQIKKVVSNSGEELVLTNIEQELLEYNLNHPDHHIEYNDTDEPDVPQNQTD